MPFMAIARIDGKIELSLGDDVFHVITREDCKELISQLNKAWNAADAYVETECKCKYMPGRRATGEQPCIGPENTGRKECPYTTEGARRLCPNFTP